MAGNWRLLTSIVIGTVLAAAILSATAIYSDAIRDLGLDFAIEKEDIRDLDLVVLQSNIPVEAARYERAQARQSAKIVGVSDQSYTVVNRSARSATYFATQEDQIFVVGDSSFPRANFMWRSDLVEHVELVEGTWPIAQPSGSAQQVEVAIGQKTATEQDFSIGQELEVYPFWEKEPMAVPVVITGIIKENDSNERYWGQTNFVRLDGKERAWDTYLLWIPESTAYGTLIDLSPTITADYRNTYQLVPERLNSRNSLLVSTGLDRLEPDLASTETRLTIRTDLPDLLRTYDQKLFFTRIPLLVLLLQVGGIVAYYLITVSTMLVDRQSSEIATLRSRGATTRQLLTQYAAEGAILAAIAIGLGPLVAATVISALGPTPAFSAISDGGRLEVHISMAAYILACIGALIAFLALMVPAWRATRNTVVEYKKSQARPDKPPLFIRLYLDVAFMVILALVYWRVSREGDLLAERFFGGQQELDPLLLATPAVFMVTVGVVFLRLFPPTLRLISWLIGWTRSVALLIGMRSLVRNPGNYSRLVLLLMFATGVGMFGATFSATLDRSYTERAEYAAGSSLRAVLSLANQAPGETATEDILGGKPEGDATLALRTRATLWRTSDNPREVEILGVDPNSFSAAAFFRNDFAENSITEIVQDLDSDSVRLAGPLVPESARQVGLWLKFENLAGRINVNTVLADGDGRLNHFAMGAVRPGDPATEDWMLFTADVTKPADKFGNAKVAPLPYNLRGLTFTASSRLTAQQANIRIGPLIYTTSDIPPPAPEGANDEPTTSSRFSWYFGLDGGARGVAPWPDAALIHDFVDGGFSPLSGARAGSSGDFLSIDVDSPAGIERTTTLSWVSGNQTRGYYRVHGLMLDTVTTDLKVYLDKKTAADMAIEIGDEFALNSSSRWTRGTLSGVFDYFPTYIPNSNTGFAVVNGDRLQAAINVALPDNSVGSNELWFRSASTSDPTLWLDEFEYDKFFLAETIRTEQQEDPLIAAGWSGILAISFGAVLLLSAIGFMVYSYLNAQLRGLEFAIMRTLGFSRPQVFSLVLFEHLFVVLAGLGLGTAVGLFIGRFMMSFLATDEVGNPVVPPFILEFSWAEVFLVWGILSLVFVLTVAAVVTLYFRLAIHRALRIGDA